MSVRESLALIIVDLTDKKPRLRGHPLRGFDLRPRRGFGHPGAKSVAYLGQRNARPSVGLPTQEQ